MAFPQIKYKKNISLYLLMSNKINAKQLVKRLFNFIRDKYPQIEPAGLLQSRLAYGKFNPSAGHHLTDPVINDKSPHLIKSFSLIERCLREADSSRIGLSNRHLTFFEMFAFHSYGRYSALPKRKSTEIFYKLLTEGLGLNKNRLLITVLKSCDIENQKLNEQETQEIYDSWCNLIGKERIKRTKGRRNFFIARIPGAAGGTGFEVYYKMNNGKYIEIGSQVAYHYIYHGPNNLHKTVNGTLGSGLGLERLLMALEGVNSVYDTSLVRPIKDIVVKALDDGTEQLYEDNINVIADHTRAISFIVYEKERQNKELTNSQKKILRKFVKGLNSSIVYLGLDPTISKDLVDKTIDIYKNRFPDLPKYRNKILESIRQMPNS